MYAWGLQVLQAKIKGFLDTQNHTHSFSAHQLWDRDFKGIIDNGVLIPKVLTLTLSVY
jgi:hypothetical protein